MCIKTTKFTLAICFSIVALAFAAKAQTCTPAPVGLVSLYAAENNALDSRSRNNGTLQNGATFAAGKVGQAFDLDGVDDFVFVPASSSLDVGAGNGLTFEAWVKPDATVGYPIFEYDSSTQVGLHMFLSSSGFNNINVGGLGNGSNLTTDNNLVPNGIFSHVALTYDKTSEIARIFVNGGLILTSNIGVVTPQTTFNLNIGGRTLFGQDRFDGRIDELSIYNRALSASEIQAVFNVGTAGKCKPTATVAPSGQVAWLAGDGDARDIVAGTDNGTLQNGAGFAVSKVGQGFNFDGNNDFVSFGDPANLKFTNTDFTVEGWFMIPDVPNNPGSQCGARYPIFGYDNGYSIEIGGDGRLRFRKSGQSNSVSFGTVNPLSTNAFHHYTAIHTPTEMRLYVDGVLDNTLPITDGTVVYVGGDFPEMGHFTCGAFGSGTIDFFFKGQIDETSIYNRALTAAEITSIFNAGIAGKLKQNQTTDTTNLVSLWQAEGNANDTRGTNNGTYTANTYAAGRVGQAFTFSSRPGVIVPDSATLNQQKFTLEAFVTASPYNCPGGPNDCQAFFISKSGSLDTSGYEFGVREAGKLRFSLNGGAGGADLFSLSNIADGNFHHVAATYDGATMIIYIDGVLDAQKSIAVAVSYQSGSQFYIGDRELSGATFPYPGKIDEAAFYNRALTVSEIRANFQNGNALSTTVGDARVIFPTVSAAGTTQQIPLNPALFPSLPTGSTTAGLTYDIATNAIFTGSPQVCFNLPSITTSGAFGNLRILHLENNAWIPRTGLINFSTRTLCTSGLTALSPFTIVNGAPTAAGVSVGGRVSTASGRGINKARISLTNANGETRTALTNPFGFYQFADVGAGESYIISASSKAHEFAAPTQLLTVTEATNSVNFTAIEGMQKLPQ